MTPWGQREEGEGEGEEDRLRPKEAPEQTAPKEERAREELMVEQGRMEVQEGSQERQMGQEGREPSEPRELRARQEHQVLLERPSGSTETYSWTSSPSSAYWDPWASSPYRPCPFWEHRHLTLQVCQYGLKQEPLYNCGEACKKAAGERQDEAGGPKAANKMHTLHFVNCSLHIRGKVVGICF